MSSSPRPNVSEHSTVIPPPRVPEEVTAAWLSDVLNQKVKSIELSKQFHSTASKLFCTVTYDDEGAAESSRPTHICIKGGFSPELLAALPFLAQIYQRETDFFSKIAPSLRMSLPKVWYADHGVLVMNDLAYAGCVFGDPLDTWSVERVKSGVEQLAVLHADTWNVQEEKYPCITSDYPELVLNLMQQYDEFINAKDGPPVLDYLRDKKRAIAAVEKYHRTRNPRFRCLIHCDPHVGNAYLMRDGQVRFIDFQLVHISSAFHDLAYFVGSALSIEDRRAHEDEIIDYYLNSLAEQGGPRLARDEEVVAEYAHSFMSGYSWVVTPYSLQSMEKVHTMTKRFMAAIQDHKTIELLEALPEVAT